ncbi:MAG: rod shape-determining protein MreD [Prochlorococcaceae cyanobacterium]|jgi:cell shape-determining protein MreD|nr:rod shape-determining protein MreD [Cyanobacteria bacterium K_DeepCast_35m_m2_155]
MTDLELWRRGWCLATALLVPLMVLLSPRWLQLDATGPAWSVLWLLPWALVDGPWSGALVGAGLALLLDALHPGAVSQVPALVLLGWWWGRLGRRSVVMERSLSLGLLALAGSLVLGVSVLAQLALTGAWPASALQVLWAQTLLTALLAPLVCSLWLLIWRQQLPGVR